MAQVPSEALLLSCEEAQVISDQVIGPASVDQANDTTQPAHQWIRAAASGVAYHALRLKLFRKDQSSSTGSCARIRLPKLGPSYETVYSTLEVMASLPEGDELAITAAAESDARSFVMLLALYDVPPPKLMSHSGDTVVFGWRGNELQQFLTLEEGRATLLRVFTKPRRKMTCEFDRSDDEQMAFLIKTLGGKQWKASAT